MINITVTASVDPTTPLDTMMLAYVDVMTTNALSIPDNVPFSIEQDRDLNVTAILVHFRKANVPDNQRNTVLDAWDAIVIAHGLTKVDATVEALP